MESQAEMWFRSNPDSGHTSGYPSNHGKNDSDEWGRGRAQIWYRTSSAEACGKRCDRPALKQPPFNWNAPDKCVELASFEMEVMNMLQIKTHELTEEEKVPVIKNCIGSEVLQLI